MSPAPTVLPGRAFRNTDRKGSLVLHWRAGDLSLDPITEQTATLTRAGDTGRLLARGAEHWLGDAGYERRLGIGVPDGEPGWDWVLNKDSIYEAALSLGAARINLCTSNDFNAGWTSIGTPVVTTGVSDPTFGTGGYTIADDNAGAAEGKFLAFSFTGDAAKSAAFVVKQATMATSGTQTLNVWDDISGANRLSLAISAWTSGNPTVTATTGTLLGKRYVGNGYWAIFGQTTVVDASHAHDFTIYPAATAAATGSITVFRAMAFNALAPCPEILAASVTRPADTLYWTFNDKPRAMSVYTKFVEQGTVLTASSRILQIGLTGAATDPRVVISAAGGVYVGEHDNGTTDATATLAVAPSMYDEVELLLTLSDTGLPTIYQSINGAKATTAAGGAAAFASAWAGERLYLGCDPAGGNGGLTAFRSVKVAKGVQTMAMMREAM